MKHRSKTTVTYTNTRCAHLLSGVLWPCLSVTRITSVYCKLCMSESYASKRLYTACFYSNKLFAVIFLSMSVTMHRQCMTSYKSVNPTTKHLSLVRHGHLRCLPSLPETSTEGTEIYAMSAIEMHSDMISTCSNLDTQN